MAATAAAAVASCAPRLIAISGSLRAASYNRKLLELAVAGARGAGATVDVFDLKAKPLPFYDGDVEASMGGAWSGNVKELRDAVAGASGLIVSTPEYNASISAVLKNAIDWLSRSANGSENVLQGKRVASVGGSMGRFATIRAQDHLRAVLAVPGAELYPVSVMIGSVHTLFDDKGECNDKATVERLNKLGADFVADIQQRRCRELALQQRDVAGFTFADCAQQQAKA